MNELHSTFTSPPTTMSAFKLVFSLVLVVLSLTFSPAVGQQIHLHLTNLVSPDLGFTCNINGQHPFKGPLPFKGVHEIVLNSNRDWCWCYFEHVQKERSKMLVMEKAYLYNFDTYSKRCTRDCHWSIAMNGLSLVENNKPVLTNKWEEEEYNSSLYG